MDRGSTGAAPGHPLRSISRVRRRPHHSGNRRTHNRALYLDLQASILGGTSAPEVRWRSDSGRRRCLMVGGGIGAATATPDSVPEKSALVASSKPSPSATPTATSPANSPCTTAAESRTYNDKLFICTMGSNERLVWLDETESKRVVALKIKRADKAAADKLGSGQSRRRQGGADKAAAAKWQRTKSPPTRSRRTKPPQPAGGR